jgi:hypothetical protein
MAMSKLAVIDPRICLTMALHRKPWQMLNLREQGKCGLIMMVIAFQAILMTLKYALHCKDYICIVDASNLWIRKEPELT